MIKERISLKDAYSLGLLYVFIYSNEFVTKIDESKLKKFKEEIEYNLSWMDHESTCLFDTNEEEIYEVKEENGKIYYCLKENFDFENAREIYIEHVPLNNIIASKMNNALNAIGLVRENGNTYFIDENKKLCLTK